MTSAWNNGDYETYEKIFRSRSERLNTLLTMEADLMEYGNFTWSDVQKVKVIERRYHINRINEKLEKKYKQSLK